MGLIDLADFIFAKDDEDDPEDKQLQYYEFMEIVLSLRGSNLATVKDMTDLRKFIKTSINKIEEKITKKDTIRQSRRASLARGDDNCSERTSEPFSPYSPPMSPLSPCFPKIVEVPQQDSRSQGSKEPIERAQSKTVFRRSETNNSFSSGASKSDTSLDEGKQGCALAQHPNTLQENKQEVTITSPSPAQTPVNSSPWSERNRNSKMRSSMFAPRDPRKLDVCMHASRLEGVLAGTLREIDGFHDNASSAVVTCSCDSAGEDVNHRDEQFKECLNTLRRRTAKLANELRITTQELQRLNELN